MSEIKKSEICTGYNLGPRCVSCCIVEATVCKNNYWFEKSFDILFKSEGEYLTHFGGVYEERKNDFLKQLRETTQRFEEFEQNELLNKILQVFKASDRYHPSDCYDKKFVGTYVDEFHHKTGFIGIIDNEPGCLLRRKHEQFLNCECKSYLCKLVDAAERNPDIYSVMKEFIEKTRPDSFGYSRIIHILAQHKSIHKEIGINIDKLSIEQLIFLKELVEKDKEKIKKK